MLRLIPISAFFEFFFSLISFSSNDTKYSRLYKPVHLSCSLLYFRVFSIAFRSDMSRTMPSSASTSPSSLYIPCPISRTHFFSPVAVIISYSYLNGCLTAMVRSHSFLKTSRYSGEIISL